MLAGIDWGLPWDVPQEVTAWQVIGYCIAAAVAAHFLTVLILYAIDNWREERKWRRGREKP